MRNHHKKIQLKHKKVSLKDNFSLENAYLCNVKSVS